MQIVPMILLRLGLFFSKWMFNAKQFALLNSKADIIAEFGVFPGDNTGVEVENSFSKKPNDSLY